MPCGILNLYPRHTLCIKHKNCFFKKRFFYFFGPSGSVFRGIGYVKIFSLVLSFLKRNCFLSANSVNFSFLCCSFQAGMLTSQEFFAHFLYFSISNLTVGPTSCRPTCVLPHHTVLYGGMIFISLALFISHHISRQSTIITMV